MTNNSTIKVITFDLDDTLWQLKPVIIEAEQVVFNWLSEQAPKFGAHFSQQSFSEWKWQRYNRQPPQANQISQLRIDSMEQALAESGYPQSQAQQLASDAFAVFLQARHQVTLFDGVESLLKDLHGRYSLGVLTNGNADIQRLAIGSLFDFSFSAEQLNASKPAADHFLAAQQISGARAEQIIHIGDHIEHDVDGACLAGCHAIWFNPHKSPRPQRPHPFLEAFSLAEIPALIASLEH
ncbi:MAG: HAD superfamily hydrolase (TIGR01549 family) [Paraglaciecola psychrophila]|jgi:HAD superfamily hydrolase (TIGR01549 family)